MITRSIAYPESIIQQKGEIENFCILQKGSLGLVYKSGYKSILNGSII
jgi:hypothetical protein